MGESLKLWENVDREREVTMVRIFGTKLSGVEWWFGDSSFT